MKKTQPFKLTFGRISAILYFFTLSLTLIWNLVLDTKTPRGDGDISNLFPVLFLIIQQITIPPVIVCSSICIILNKSRNTAYLFLAGCLIYLSISLLTQYITLSHILEIFMYDLELLILSPLLLFAELTGRQP